MMIAQFSDIKDTQKLSVGKLRNFPPSVWETEKDGVTGHREFILGSTWGRHFLFTSSPPARPDALLALFISRWRRQVNFHLTRSALVMPTRAVWRCKVAFLLWPCSACRGSKPLILVFLARYKIFSINNHPHLSLCLCFFCFFTHLMMWKMADMSSSL